MQWVWGPKLFSTLDYFHVHVFTVQEHYFLPFTKQYQLMNCQIVLFGHIVSAYVSTPWGISFLAL